MSVFRVNKNKNYTCISNECLKDRGLSLKAKGLLVLMLSLPDTWDYSIEGLTAICSECKNTIVSILKELELNGYLTRTKVRNEKGQIIDTCYDIYESKIDDDRKPKKPYMENQDMEKPYMENQPQLNTKELSTKELNTNKYDDVVRENRKIINYCEQYLGGSLTKQALDDLIDYIEFGMDADLIIRAVDKARDTNNRRWAYVNGILKNWKKDNIKTTEQAIEQDNLFHNKNDKPMSEEERRKKRTQEIAEMIKKGIEDDNLRGRR